MVQCTGLLNLRALRLTWVRIPPPPPLIGGVEERLSSMVLKTIIRANGSWVRIPPPPPFSDRFSID